MQKYTPGDDAGFLESWPFENPASNYVIISGSPKASGRIDTGGNGYETRSGIWRCTVGAFECIEQGDELMTVLSGRCSITNHDTGVSVSLVAGDTLFISDQSHVTWEVHEEITKVFYGQKPGGY